MVRSDWLRAEMFGGKLHGTGATEIGPASCHNVCAAGAWDQTSDKWEAMCVSVIKSWIERKRKLKKGNNDDDDKIMIAMTITLTMQMMI